MPHNTSVSNIPANDSIDMSAQNADENEASLSDEATPSPDASQDSTLVHDGEDESDGADVYLPIYNGEAVPIRADDRERVTTLLREGLRFEKFLPQFEMLREMSLAAGFHRPEELILHLQRAAKQDARASHLPDATATSADENPPRERALEERLAEEYEELCNHIAESPDFSALPEEVIEEACLQGRPLLDCYLRFEKREQQRRDNAKQAERSASACAVGSLNGNTDEFDGHSTAFRRAFRRSL